MDPSASLPQKAMRSCPIASVVSTATATSSCGEQASCTCLTFLLCSAVEAVAHVSLVVCMHTMTIGTWNPTRVHSSMGYIMVSPSGHFQSDLHRPLSARVGEGRCGTFTEGTVLGLNLYPQGWYSREQEGFCTFQRTTYSNTRESTACFRSGAMICMNLFAIENIQIQQVGLLQAGRSQYG